ncbi:MAG: hypothetical protein QOG12_1811, partial [Verrucomicrobiota bacterium]
MTIKKIIGAIVTVLSFGLITSHGGQIEIVEVDDYYAYGDERDPNAVFIGVDSWEGVTGEAWVDSAGQIVGGDLWIQ